MVVIVMGPAGAGKTTVGRALAVALGWAFVEADELHSPANVEKMRRGEGLTDTDRAPWLDELHGVVAAAIERNEPTVIACSALKERYRAQIAGGLPQVHFVYLKTSAGVLRERLATRAGHYAGPALVASQLADLEEPRDALVVDATKPVDEIIALIRHEFDMSGL